MYFISCTRHLYFSYFLMEMSYINPKKLFCPPFSMTKTLSAPSPFVGGKVYLPLPPSPLGQDNASQTTFQHFLETFPKSACTYLGQRHMIMVKQTLTMSMTLSNDIILYHIMYETKNKMNCYFTVNSEKWLFWSIYFNQDEDVLWYLTFYTVTEKSTMREQYQICNI